MGDLISRIKLFPISLDKEEKIVISSIMVLLSYNTKNKKPITYSTMRCCYFFIVLLICSCGTSKDGVNQVGQPMETTKIGFFNYLISKTSAELVEIKFIDKIIVDGKLKTDGSLNNSLQKNTLKLFQIDNDSQALDSMYIENPLSKTVEYVNDDGQYEKRTINLDHAEFSVRLQLNSNTTGIAIYGFDNSSKPLIKHKL